MARVGRTDRRRGRHARARVLPLVMVGAGLILLSGVAFAWLAQIDQGQGAGSQKSGYESVVPVAVDYPAPQISLVDINRQPASLADYTGSVVLVNNWAIWCPPCKAEMPVLQDYYNDYRHLGFTIIGIESGEPLADVVAFVSQYGLTFPIWTDPGQVALVAFRNSSLPSSYIIDRQGQVRLAWTGAISREMLDKFVTPLLEQ